MAAGAPPGSELFFARTESARYAREPFIDRFARFAEWRGKRVLEVGCGTGADLSRFARGGARSVGLDLTPTGAALARARTRLGGRGTDTVVGDAEQLPFPDGMFDLVYSWGVIHHTSDTQLAAREIVRVARPNGKVVVMIYHRRSLVALQAYLRYGLLAGKPLRSLPEIIASRLESPGTKAYTIEEARSLFAGLSELMVTPVRTPYDLRIGRNRFLPSFLSSLVPHKFGYFLVVMGNKPAV